MKLKRTISFMLALTLTVSMSVINVFATTTSLNEETETEESVEASEDVIYDTENEVSVAVPPSDNEARSEVTPVAPFSGTAEKMDQVLMLGEIEALEASNKIVIELPEVDDAKTFTMQIDHSLYPEAILSVFTYGALGDVKVDVSDVGSCWLQTKPSMISRLHSVKEVIKINGTGGVKDYTVTVSTPTGNAAAALVLATEDTYSEMCSNRENATSIQKNVSMERGVTAFLGTKTLLKGDGEWFRYTADGDTYIHAYATLADPFTVSVYDADTGTRLGVTEKKDQEIQRDSDTIWTGNTSKKFALQPGHEYLIQVQSDATFAADSSSRYCLSVGLPHTLIDRASVSSTSTYSIPSYTTKTFVFNVSGYPKSTRLAHNGFVRFQTGKSVNNLNIISCTFKAPNGKVLTAQRYGEYTFKTPIDYNNYLTSYNNIPLNGTWTVSIKANAALSGIKFNLNCQTAYIAGSDGNE